MPAISLPTSPGQIFFLLAAMAGFAAFAISLFWVSASVTLSKSAAEKPVEREVTPARRMEAPSAAHRKAA